MVNIKEYLASLELFKAIDPSQLGIMASAARLAFFSGGQKLITESERDADVIVITEGEAEIRKHMGEAGEVKLLATVGAGTILGEMSALTNEAASAEVAAKGTCKAIRIPRSAFMEAVKKNPSTLAKLTTTAVRRYREMMGQH